MSENLEPDQIPLPVHGFQSIRRKRELAKRPIDYRLTGPGYDVDPDGRQASTFLLVAATRRCGSSLLCEGIASLGQLGTPIEYFDIHGTRCYVLSERWGCSTVGAYVHELMQRRKSSAGYFSAKVHWDQLSTFAQFWYSGNETLKNDPVGSTVEFADKVLQRPRFIYISRRDKLRQAISLHIARQTGIWKDTGEGADGLGRTAQYDQAAISRTIHEISLEEEAWERFFQAAGVDPVRIAYEDLVDSFAPQIRNIVEKIGLKSTSVRVAPPTLRRQASQLNEIFAARYLSG